MNRPEGSSPLSERASAPRFLGARRIGIWERDVPTPGPGELLVAVRANAICGSDRSQYEDGSDIVPGHEAGGVVVSAGNGTSTPIGTPGVVYLMDFCGLCRSCRARATNQCLAKRADMGFTRDGGYGPYELVHETNFFAVPVGLPLVEATLLLDVMGTTGHAIGRARLVTPDPRAIAIAGAGPLGLGLIVVALVESLGGRGVDLVARSFAEGLRDQGLNDVDIAIDTAGRASSRRALLNLLARRGSLVCIGHGQGLDLDVSVDLIAPERAILGSEYFRYDELAGNLALLLANRDAFRAIITDRFPIGELPRALELFMSGTTGKVVVEQ
jgi:threonine 3-dehydrogenase